MSQPYRPNTEANDAPASAFPGNDVDMTRIDVERDAYTTKSHFEEDSVDPDVQIVDWDGPNDPENPFNWPKRRKVILTLVALLGTLTVLINGTSITVAAVDINKEFGISDATFPNSYWPVTSWTIGGGVFMLVLLPMMEEIGVRWGYLITYFLFLCFVVPQAVCQNFWTLVIVRFFAGGCVSLVANATAGIICDIWAGDKGRAVPFSGYLTCYLVGSSIGPVIGGAILQFLPWRWIVYIQLIWYGAFFPIYILVIRETRGNVILKQKARNIRAKTGKNAYTHAELYGPKLADLLKTSIKRPMFMLCTEWVVFTFTIWSSFSVGLVYIFTQSTVQVFQGLYGWSDPACGYVQGAIVIGELLAWVTTMYQERLYFDSAKRNKDTPGVPIPEARLYSSVVGAFVGMAGGMFVYAWTSYESIHWIAPAIGLGMVGWGIGVVLIAIAEYVTDGYSKYAASVVAAVAFGENVFSGFLPLAAQSMYTTLGYRWASSLLAFLAFALGFAPVVLMVWGKGIRARSPFMSQASYDA